METYLAERRQPDTVLISILPIRDGNYEEETTAGYIISDFDTSYKGWKPDGAAGARRARK